MIKSLVHAGFLFSRIDGLQLLSNGRGFLRGTALFPPTIMMIAVRINDIFLHKTPIQYINKQVKDIINIQIL